MTKLKLLDISHNKLVSFPLGIRAMQLENLNATNNPLCVPLQELLWLQKEGDEIKIRGMKNEDFLASYPTDALFHTETHKRNLKWYFGLGSEKWMEYIDSCFHDLGKMVFDTGAHGGDKEFGYNDSMENACLFVAASLHLKIDADWFLQLHRYTCAHCDGKDFTHMTKERIGTFRGSDTTGVKRPGLLSYDTLLEFMAFENELKANFGRNFEIGKFHVHPTQSDFIIAFNPITDEQMRDIINLLLKNLHQELDLAKDIQDHRLFAIAKFHQRLVWLHPPQDGTYRTCTLILNKLLIENGFFPVILDDPGCCVDLELASFIDELDKGMELWVNYYKQYVKDNKLEIIT